jgi:hypothetical protein
MHIKKTLSSLTSVNLASRLWTDCIFAVSGVGTPYRAATSVHVYRSNQEQCHQLVCYHSQMALPDVNPWSAATDSVKMRVARGGRGAQSNTILCDRLGLSPIRKRGVSILQKI